jgi:hypothetical protein
VLHLNENSRQCHSFIHSKLRNRLENEKVNKLIFIKNNGQQIAQDTWDWSDEEDKNYSLVTEEGQEKTSLEEFKEDSE